MPYSQARYWMLGVIAVILVGFWPSYWATVTNVPWQFHAHGVAASLWVTMVTVQCWTSQSKRQLELHRAIGKASLFLFPFLTAGLAAIINRQSQNWLAGEPLHLLYGPSFMIGTMVAMAAYVTVFYRALKFRRKVWVHAGYMLSTPLILLESPLSRAGGFFFPPWHVTGPADFPKVMASIEWSMAIELAIIAIVWWRVGDRAKPFLVTAALIAVEMLAMGFAGDVALIRHLDTVIAHMPAASVVLSGFLIGAATSWFGWQAGKRPVAGPVAAQPA